MRQVVAFILLVALIWGTIPIVQPFFDGKGAAAYAKSGSSDDDDSDDDDDDDNSGSSGNSGSGSSGSGSSGSGSSGSGSSGSGSSSSSSSGSGSSQSGSGSSTLFGGDGIHLQFSDGHIERIRGNRFETLDARGRVVESRTARRSDLNRLRALGSASVRQGGRGEVQNVAQVNEASGAIDITDFRGWREIVSRGSYELKDPRGRTIVRRTVTTEDIRRIRAMLNLD